MKLLSITIMQSCNYNCSYCTFKEWKYPIDMVRPLLSTGEEKPINCITNEALLSWLDAFIEPEEWYIKITGGEPGLYSEIETLIPALNERGYKGYIETNGSLPIPKSDNFIRLAAWHYERPIPEYYDIILIIENPNDDWQAKITYCESNNIPYTRTILRGEQSPIPLEERKSMDETREPSIFTGILQMYSQGELMMCPTHHHNYGDIWEMIEPRPQPLANRICSRCHQTIMADYILKLNNN